jgi:hypothetical protein
MRVRKPRRIDEYLEGLADFLNSTRSAAADEEIRRAREASARVVAGRDEAKAEHAAIRRLCAAKEEVAWRSFCRRIKKHPTMDVYFYSYSPVRLRVSRMEAKNIREEIHRDLAYLRTEEYLPMPYGALAQSLTGLQLKMHYQVNAARKPKPGQAILRSDDKRKWVATAQPIAENTRELLYGILAAALLNGTLNRLKLCKQCQKYLAVKERKREFCPGTSCKDDFFNRERKGSPNLLPRHSPHRPVDKRIDHPPAE